MLMQTRNTVRVRWMIKRDFAEVLWIEQATFRYPWTEQDFCNTLSQRQCIAQVAETPDGAVIGYSVYELDRKRFKLLNLAVAPGYQRSGVGKQLIEKLIGKLSHQNRQSIDVMVRESNLSAQLFFRSLGFKATSIYRDHYQDAGEDGYLLRLNIAHRLPTTPS